MKTEQLPDRHPWLRIACHDWSGPLDPHYAQKDGGRWNPPNSFPPLYLNEDLVTARLNLRLFIEPWPYEPEDLRDDTGPLLVSKEPRPEMPQALLVVEDAAEILSEKDLSSGLTELKEALIETDTTSCCFRAWKSL